MNYFSENSRGYIYSFFIMLAAVATQYAIINLGNIPVPGILYPMAFLAAWYYGFGPALMAILLSIVGSNLFFYEPILKFKILAFTDYVRLGIFVVTSIVAASIVARGKKAHLREFKTRAELKESLEVLEIINRFGKSMMAELDHEKLVQHVTDAGAQLSKADFGVFFYTMIYNQNESSALFSISGLARNAFTKFPVANDIVTAKDFEIQNGLKPILSFMSIPVITRSGEKIGNLYFGSTTKKEFSKREERVVHGIASQAAIAMDNARLFDRANQAIQIRDEFLSISSHELRTPLTPLKIQIQALGKHIERGTFNELSMEQLKKMLATTEKQVNRITVLVDDLLDVTRMTSGNLTLNVEEVNVSDTTVEVIERYKVQIAAAKCTVELDITPGLIASVDLIRFEQILINLITNAIKYAAGKPVKISLKKVDHNISLRVSDQGMGISEDDQKRIFDRFTRTNSSTAQGGLGLGLYIVKQIMTAHHGTVEIESQKNHGTTFILNFPIS